MNVLSCSSNENLSPMFDFFNGNRIVDRAEAIAYIKCHYEQNNKKLVQFGYRNSKSILFRCADKNCLFRIVCKKTVKDSYFLYYRKGSFLTHGIGNSDETMNFGMCGLVKAASTVTIFVY